jgi:hypothetical protein
MVLIRLYFHDGSLGFSGDTAGNDPYKTQYVADRLKNKKGYDPDLPTLLIACGAASTIDAQIFSTDLNDQVWASPDPLTPPVENGQPVLGGDPIAFYNGGYHWPRWQVFYPQQSPQTQP